MQAFSFRAALCFVIFVIVCLVESFVENDVCGAIIEPVGVTPAGRRSNGPYMIGYDFTVGGANITINALGGEDITNSGGAGYGDGTFAATQVGIWNSSGTLLGSATVKSLTQSPIINGFRYEPLSAPITLLAGQTYTIGSQKGAGVDFFSDGNPTANYSSGAGVTLGTPRYNSVATFSQPIANAGGVIGRWSGGNATEVNSAPADTPALFNWAGTGTSLTERNNYSGTVGYQFTTGSQAMKVSSLGFFDHNLDGLATSHRVGIWDANTATLLGEVTIAAGTADMAYGFFRYHDLAAPLYLSSNTTYLIGAQVFSGGDIWYNNVATGSSTFSFNPSTDPNYAGFVVDRGVYVGGGVFAAPILQDGAGQYFLSANMLAVAVPEPGSLLLLALGSIVLVFQLCRCQRARLVPVTP